VSAAEDITQAVLAKWDVYRGLVGAPPRREPLWVEGGRGVWVTNEWGPAVPYPSADHEGGSRNYGYIRIKDAPQLVEAIPEVAGFPELATFLARINSAESPIESVGCEKSFSPNNVEGQPPLYLGSFIDVLFTEAALNESGENTIHLAAQLLQAVEGGMTPFRCTS